MKKSNTRSLKLKGILLVILMSLMILGSLNLTIVNSDVEPQGFWQEIALNNLHPLLDESHERKALSDLVDRDWIVSTMPPDSDGIFAPAYTTWFPPFPWYKENLQTPQIAPPAKNPLEEDDTLQYEHIVACDCDEPDMTAIVTSSNELRIGWATEIVQTWNEAGYCIDLVAMNWVDEDDPCGGIIPRIFWQPALYDDDPSTTIPTYEECGYDMVFLGFSFAIPDPMLDPIIVGHIDEMYTFGHPENFYQYSNPTFDALVQSYIRTGGNRGLAYAIQNILYNTVPAIILFVGLYLGT